MLITYKNFDKITFPVFRLESDNLEMADGILWSDNRVLDDRNMPGATLGLRRLQTPFKDIVPLPWSIPTVVNLIRNRGGSYIDSTGLVIYYEKTKMVKLAYYKIRKIQPQKTHSLVWVSNLNFPFTVPRPPDAGLTWAGILHINDFPWLLYEFAEKKLKRTIRKI
jgi:hypothetical protein